MSPRPSAPRFVARDLVSVAPLTAAWVLLWGDIRLGNVLTGVGASTLLLLVFPIGHDVEAVRHRIRPIGVVRLAVAFAWELVSSSLVMVREVLGGSSRERPGIVACPLRVDAPGLVTFLTNVFAMSPGTMPIEVSHAPPVIYLHVLRLDDPELVRARVTRFETIAVRALGDDDALAAVTVPPPPPPHLRPEVER
jgi:multicomponent Na+:H+ antiporter subunit E